MTELLPIADLGGRPKTTLKLITPSPSKEYQGMTWSTEKVPDVLQASTAIIAAVVQERVPGVAVSCLGDTLVQGETIEDYSFRHRTTQEIVDFALGADVVGMSVLFHNLEHALKISEILKSLNPHQIIVFGGKGVADPKTASLVLRKNPSVDKIVYGDGEETMVGILKGQDPRTIPNLVFRQGGEIKMTRPKLYDLNQRPIYDFTTTVDYEDVMRPWDCRTLLYAQLRDGVGHFIGRVGVQYTLGCEKSAEMGPCSYCTSQRTTIQSMDAKRFWVEVNHLYQIHGINEGFITDDILAKPEKVKSLLVAREKVPGLPSGLQFRAYGFAPDFTAENTPIMVQQMKKMGVVNLFFGVENLYPGIAELSNKQSMTYEEMDRIIGAVTAGGIDVFLPIMIGLPGETVESIMHNVECVDKLLRKYAKQKYGEGGVVRVDFSLAMALRGTPWYNRLIHNQDVRRHYLAATGVDVEEDPFPNYDVLGEASALFYRPTNLDPKLIGDYIQLFVETALKFLRPEQIGGFNFQVKEERLRARSL